MTEVVRGIIKSDKGSFCYQKYGQGSNSFLAFHGFGQSGVHLQPLNKIGANYTLYHFDLPHHGDSSWEEGEVIQKEEVELVFKQFFKQEKIDKFSIGAFSLGGKLLFTLLEKFPEKIESIVLIAPDGIKTNQWYKLATMNGPFRWLFKTMVENPTAYFFFADLLMSVGLLDKSIVKFVKHQMDTREKREQVYRVWRAYKALRFTQEDLINALNQNEIRTYLYLGTYDRVIPIDKLMEFRTKISQIRYYEVSSGHNQLIEKVADRIRTDMLLS